MPNYFTYAGYRLYFWSNESDEPIHVHVSKGKPTAASTKFWVLRDGSVKLASNKAELSKKELKKVAKFIEANYEEICIAWNDFFQLSSQETKFYH